MGRIELIFGPMFSGKTTELLRRLNRYRVAKKRCLLITHIKNTKDWVSKNEKLSERVEGDSLSKSCEIVSHCGGSKHVAIFVENVNEVRESLKDVDVLGVDEGQFFDEEIVDELDDLATRWDKIVIVASLDGDFKRRPFGHIYKLISKVEYVTKLTAICAYCQSESASFSFRIDKTDKKLESLGGSEKYEALCRACYDVKSHYILDSDDEDDDGNDNNNNNNFQ